MVLPLPFSVPQGGQEIVAKKKWFIVTIMVLQVVFLPFLFMTSDFTVGSGVMQIFILIFGALTLWTYDLGQMIPWATMALFELIFGLVAVIFQAVRGAGPELYGGNDFVRKKLAYGFEIANVVLLACIVGLTYWTYKEVAACADRLPLADQGAQSSPYNNPRQQSSFTAFSGDGNRLGDEPNRQAPNFQGSGQRIA